MALELKKGHTEGRLKGKIKAAGIFFFCHSIKCLILKGLPWWICYYCFCSHIQSLVELESVIVATAPYFEHTAPLTYSLWLELVFFWLVNTMVSYLLRLLLFRALPSITSLLPLLQTTTLAFTKLLKSIGQLQKISNLLTYYIPVYI